MTHATTDKPRITFEDFQKLDLRVARITHAEHHPNADKLLVLKLDDGSPEGRQVCAGVRAWYEPGDLVGKLVVIVANLEPRTLRGQPSEGMVLAATVGDPGNERDVVLLTLDRPVDPGAPVS